jgi:hypothetical protein
MSRGLLLELGAVVAAKLAALTVLYLLCFTPAHHTTVDTRAWIAGPATSRAAAPPAAHG